MTVDVIQLLREQIKILEKVDELGDDADVSQQECAIETILEHIDHIDIANDFHKIGGFTVIMPCLKSNYPSLRLGACDVLAELTQNNPYCQKIVVDEGYVPVLLEILEKDEDGRVAIKAVHALSCKSKAPPSSFCSNVYFRHPTAQFRRLQSVDPLRWIQHLPERLGAERRQAAHQNHLPAFHSVYFEAGRQE